MLKTLQTLVKISLNQIILFKPKFARQMPFGRKPQFRLIENRIRTYIESTTRPRREFVCRKINFAYYLHQDGGPPTCRAYTT